MTNAKKLELIRELKTMGALIVEVSEEGGVKVQFAPDYGKIDSNAKETPVEGVFSEAPTEAELLYSA